MESHGTTEGQQPVLTFNWDPLFTEEFFRLPNSKKNKNFNKDTLDFPVFSCPANIAQPEFRIALQTFLNGEKGKVYKENIKNLMDSLKKWVDEVAWPLKEEQSLASEEAKELLALERVNRDEALKKHLTRMINPNISLVGEIQIPFYTEAPTYFKNIVEALYSDTLPLAYLKNVMSRLLSELGGCVPAVNTRLKEAADDLSSELLITLQGIKQQIAGQVAKEVIRGDGGAPIREVHRKQGLVNCFADPLGIPIVRDGFADGEFYSDQTKMAFVKALSAALTVSAVVELIMARLGLLALKEELSNTEIHDWETVNKLATTKLDLVALKAKLLKTNIDDLVALDTITKELEKRLNYNGEDNKFSFFSLLNQNPHSFILSPLKKSAEDTLRISIMLRWQQSGLVDVDKQAKHQYWRGNEVYLLPEPDRELSYVITKAREVKPFIFYCADLCREGNQSDINAIFYTFFSTKSAKLQTSAKMLAKLFLILREETVDLFANESSIEVLQSLREQWLANLLVLFEHKTVRLLLAEQTTLQPLLNLIFSLQEYASEKLNDIFQQLLSQEAIRAVIQEGSELATFFMLHRVEDWPELFGELGNVFVKRGNTVLSKAAEMCRFIQDILHSEKTTPTQSLIALFQLAINPRLLNTTVFRSEYFKELIQFFQAFLLNTSSPKAKIFTTAIEGMIVNHDSFIAFLLNMEKIRVEKKLVFALEAPYQVLLQIPNIKLQNIIQNGAQLVEVISALPTEYSKTFLQFFAKLLQPEEVARYQDCQALMRDLSPVVTSVKEQSIFKPSSDNHKRKSTNNDSTNDSTVEHRHKRLSLGRNMPAA